MNTEMFNDEPLTDGELFAMLRESFDSDKEAWEGVKEAQAAFKELTRQLVLLEMFDEGKLAVDINQILNGIAA